MSPFSSTPPGESDAGGADQAAGPISLSDALDSLRLSVALLSGPPESPGPTRDPNPRDLTGLADLSVLPESFPNDVLDRTDSAGLTDVEWDVPRVRELVGRIAEIARIPCSEIREVGSPHELDDTPDPDEQGDPWVRYSPLRDRWGRHFGALTDPWGQRYGWQALEFDPPLDTAGSDSEPDAAPDTAPRRGLTLWATAEAEREGPRSAPIEPIARCSVGRLVLGWVGFMVEHGARGDAPHWRPSEDVRREFAVELRVGPLLVEAFCAGLGYLCPVEGSIEISRRPAVRFRDRRLLDIGFPKYHHESGPAIEFADGSGEDFLAGIPVDAWLRQALVDGALTLRHVRGLGSPALRRAAYTVMPPRALMDGVDAQQIDGDRTGARLYLLRDLPDHDGPVRYLVTTDRSTGREQGEFVPPPEE